MNPGWRSPSRPARIPRPVVAAVSIVLLVILLLPVLNVLFSVRAGPPTLQSANTPVGDMLDRGATLAEVQAWIDSNLGRLDDESWLNRTPLVEAIDAGRHDVVEALLDAGADPDAYGSWTMEMHFRGQPVEVELKSVPLEEAIEKDDGRSVALLLEAGADPTPLIEAAAGDLESLALRLGVPDLEERIEKTGG